MMRPTSQSVALETVHTIAFAVGVDVTAYNDPVKLADAVIEESQCEGLTIMTKHVQEHWSDVADRVNLNVAMATGARNILRGDWLL